MIRFGFWLGNRKRSFGLNWLLLGIWDNSMILCSRMSLIISLLCSISNGSFSSSSIFSSTVSAVLSSSSVCLINDFRSVINDEMSYRALYYIYYPQNTFSVDPKRIDSTTSNRESTSSFSSLMTEAIYSPNVYGVKSWKTADTSSSTFSPTKCSFNQLYLWKWLILILKHTVATSSFIEKQFCEK